MAEGAELQAKKCPASAQRREEQWYAGPKYVLHRGPVEPGIEFSLIPILKSINILNWILLFAKALNWRRHYQNRY